MVVGHFGQLYHTFWQELKAKGLFGWRSGKVGGWKISERMEKWEDRKDLVFPHVYLVGGVEK